MKKDLADLENKIIERAQDKADHIVSRAKKAKQRLVNSAKEKAERINSSAEQEAKSWFKRQKDRVAYEQQISQKKKLLALREDIFTRFSRDVIAQLVHLFNQGEMTAWIRKQCKQILSSEQHDFTLICRQKDKPQYQKILQAQKKVTVKSGLKDPGFILRHQRIEYDFRFAVLTRNMLVREKNHIFAALNLRGVDHG